MGASEGGDAPAATGGAGTAGSPHAAGAASSAGGAGSRAPVAGAAPAVPVVPLAPDSSLLFGACASTGTLHASLRPTNVLFLIDRSGSMSCNLPPATTSAACEQMPVKVDAAQPSKWEIVRDALKTAIAALPEGARAGITYLSNDDVCGVQSRPDVALAAVDATHIGALESSLNAVQPKGGTPLVGGLILAFKHLNPDQTPDLPSGNRFVLLLTDGEESCAKEETARLLEQELPKARTASITTFVIGVPGSEVNRAFLSQLAFAGGTASRPDCARGGADPTLGDCHFDMTRDGDLAAALSSALAAIGGRALSCEIPVPQPTEGGTLNYDEVNVVYGDQAGGEEQLIAQDAARPCDGGANGWQYDADKRNIHLCGQACSAVQRATSLRIALGCESVAVE
jgi:hypothetical protein